MAAAATGQWSFAASFGHKSVCLQLARDAKASNRHVSVAVVYDELVRNRLAERLE